MEGLVTRDQAHGHVSRAYQSKYINLLAVTVLPNFEPAELKHWLDPDLCA
jgi:hypothetical protein